MARRNENGAGIVLVGAILFAIGGIVHITDDWREPESIAMPDLVGLTVREAEDRLSEVYDAAGWEPEERHRPEGEDLAPILSKYRTVVGSWIVEQTTPAAGALIARADEDGGSADARIYLWSLDEPEHAWFEANSTMPTIPADVEPLEVLDGDGPLAEVRDLVEVRFVEGETDGGEVWYGPEMDTAPLIDDDPSIEPASEYEARHGLEWAGEYNRQVLTVGSLPAPGLPLRRGQILTVTVRLTPDEPEPPAGPSSGSSDGDATGGVGVGAGGSVDIDIDVHKPSVCRHTRFC